jgi:hypothetical protein
VIWACVNYPKTSILLEKKNKEEAAKIGGIGGKGEIKKGAK